MLSGENVILRAWGESDLDPLSALRNDLELQAQLMSQPRPNSPDKVRSWLVEKNNSSTGLFFVIADKQHETVLGYIQIAALNLIHRHAELGICVAAQQHGSGISTEALALLEIYLGDTFALRKLLLHVLADNKRAIRFYQKNGFKEVGFLRKHFYLKTTYHDVLIMEKHFQP